MKRIFGLVLTFGVLAFLGACGDPGTTPTDAPPADAPAGEPPAEAPPAP
ncbi:MAG: hypothetical protein KME20_18490 [Kaiparowitsia implicata GSE-PSE-MK54-09C]|jgi:hypothetical protein|nr:hypothetical protein [Kaiparowitsia implicata GSE-PSE-MK54-09C]